MKRRAHLVGQGIITLRTTERVGPLVSLMEVVDTDDLMIVTDKGVMICLPVHDIRSIGRNTQGVRVIRLDEGARIASISRVMEEEEGNGGEESSEEPPSAEPGLA